MDREDLVAGADAALSARSGGSRYKAAEAVRESEGSSKGDKVSNSNTMDKWTKTNTIGGYTNTISGLDTIKGVADEDNDFGMPQMDNDYANAYYFEDDDDDNDPELIVVSKKEGINNESNPYQSELNAPIIVVGKTKLGLGKAKLYGLVNDDGEIEILDKNGKSSNADKIKQRKYLHKISKPRDPVEVAVPDDAPTFKPIKNKEAEIAMRNPRCGYDFLDRLNERGNFLDRVFGNKIEDKKKKKLLESAEADYDAKLDKLACPQCKKEQSFLEYHEKRRYCSQCKEKFCRLNIFNPSSFERRMREQELKRKQGLDDIDDEMYGKTSAAKVNPNAPKTQVAAKLISHTTTTTNTTNTKQSAVLPVTSDKTVPPSSRPVATTVAPVAAVSRNKMDVNPVSTNVSSNVNKTGPKQVPNTSVSSSSVKKSAANKGDALGQLKQKQIEHQSEILALLNNKTSIQGVPTVDMLSKLAQIQKEKTELLNKAIHDAETKYTSKGPATIIPLKPKATDPPASVPTSSVTKNVTLPARNQDVPATKSSAATTNSNPIKSKTTSIVANKAKENSVNILEKDASKVSDDYITAGAIDAEDKLVASKLSKLLY